MSQYRYQVRDAAGSLSTGQLTAGSLAEAAALVRGQGYLVDISTVAAGPKGLLGKLNSLNLRPGPGLRDVMNFTNQLAVMIKAGISIRAAIEGIAEQTENPKFKQIVDQMRQDVEAGKPFSEALARHAKVFSPLYVNMVRASEMSGSFGHMLDRIAAYLRQQVETRSMVRGAMVYPIIIGAMAISTTIFLLTFVLPRFSTLFQGHESMLPLPTKMLLGMSAFLLTYWYACLGSVLAAVIGAMYYIRTPLGRSHWDRLKLRLPVLKRMFRALYITRGLQTMGEMINAGVPMLETIQITADVSGNQLYRTMWMSVFRSVKAGNKIAAPLQKSPLLPRSVVQMVSAGEESGKLGEVLNDISGFYANELRNTIKAATAMLEPLMIVLMGFIVGFIAMSIILPIFKMSQLAKK
jgi:type IV pilus assembly protein PilC